MFYSQCLLSREGALRSIWVAAYCHKKLKKDQIANTDISSSVDEIVLNEVTVTYRVLGYLLLGVVRIYSKKVEYLYHDCKEVMIKINTYSHSRKNKRPDEAMCAPYISITLPDTFELDSFDLEIVEDVSRGTMETHQLITPEETREDAQNGPYFLNKYHHEEGSASFPTTVSPVEDDISPHRMDVKMAVSPKCSLSGFETSMEKLLANQIPREEHFDFDFEMFHESGEPLDLSSQLDDMHEEQIKLMETTPPDAGEPHVLTKGDPIASPNVGSPEESKLPHNSGDVTPEVLLIPTPDKKEQKPSSRKRKQVFDEIIVLSNEVVRLSLHDSSSLVCKRRRAPQTALDAWRACTIPNLRDNFLRPLISGFSSLKALFDEKNFKTHEHVEAEGPINSGETHCKYSEHEMPEENSFGDSGFARLVKCGTTVKSDKGPTICTGDDQLADGMGEHIETPDPRLNLIDEENALSEEDQNPVADGWSIRTRTVATYLCKSFLSKKEKGESEVLNLAPTLEGRTRKESARLFYEVLVLKSRGVIDVKQETPFGDISLLATPRLKEPLLK